jgi:Ca2+-binding EF-hand superfamily protein
MRTKLAIFLGLAIVWIAVVPGLTQGPGGFGGRNGGFGGGFGGGGFGGGGKGMRGMGMGDPSQLFSMMTGGKDVWVRADIRDERQQGFFDRIAQSANVTNGQLTREQFQQGMSQMRGGRGGGGAGAGGGPNAAQGGNWIDNAAENMFRKQDTNQDGVLNNDEMPENLRTELDKWDTDKNGLIDLNEFKAWFQARMQQVMLDRNSGQGGAEQGDSERKPPVGYRIGKLPKELPAWFAELDVDQDAQIGLYEWKTSGRSLDEFNKIDRNGDGFLTVDEVLRYEAAQGRGPAPGGAGGAFAGAGSETPGFGMTPGAPGRTSFYPGGGQPGWGANNGAQGWNGQRDFGKGKNKDGGGRRGNGGKGGGDWRSKRGA